MIRWIVDRIYSIRHPQGERKLTSTHRQWTEGRRKGRKRQMRGTESKRMVTFSSRRQGGEITENNLSGGAGAMLLTAYWNALNSCLFNYANVHMQMTTVRNTMLSQLGDRLTRVGFRERPDYCPAIRLQANSFWPVIIITRHQQGGLTRRLESDVLFACNCTCWLYVWETVDVRLHMSYLLDQFSTAAFSSASLMNEPAFEGSDIFKVSLCHLPLFVTLKLFIYIV